MFKFAEEQFGHLLPALRHRLKHPGPVRRPPAAQTTPQFPAAIKQAFCRLRVKVYGLISAQHSCIRQVGSNYRLARHHGLDEWQSITFEKGWKDHCVRIPVLSEAVSMTEGADAAKPRRMVSKLLRVDGQYQAINQPAQIEG